MKMLLKVIREREMIDFDNYQGNFGRLVRAVQEICGKSGTGGVHPVALHRRASQEDYQ